MLIDHYPQAAIHLSYAAWKEGLRL